MTTGEATKVLDKRQLRDELTEAFIMYQHGLDLPFPSITETKAAVILKYQNDPIFHARVESLVSGVMLIIGKHV